MSSLPVSQDFSDLLLTNSEKSKKASLGAMEHHLSDQRNRLSEQALLLKKQLDELIRREELARLIYSAQYSFQPVLLKPYFLYKKPNRIVLSLISPDEWINCPFGEFVMSVRQLGDGTWEEINVD